MRGSNNGHDFTGLFRDVQLATGLISRSQLLPHYCRRNAIRNDTEY